MANRNKRKHAPQTKAEKIATEEAAKRRKRVRTMILGTIAASGAFQLNGWQAQAHGNRSSHASASLRSDLFLPQDYVSFRQQLLAPRAEETLVLSRLRGQLGSLRDSIGRPLAETEAEFKTLQREIDKIEDKLRLRETSRQALEFIRGGDVDAAAAVIEGEGDPEQVTYEYLWTITDLAYLGRKGTRLTDSNQADLIALSKRAMKYLAGARELMAKTGLTDIETAILGRFAEVYHNIASYMIPDVGEPTDEGIKLGYEAANRARDLRFDLGQTMEMLIADWTLATYESRLGNTKRAVKIHKRAIAQAERLENPVQIAWNKLSLARLSAKPGVRVEKDPKVIAAIEGLLEKAEPGDPVAALLRLEIANARGE